MPDEDPTAIKSDLGEKDIDVIVLGLFPRLKLYNLVPEGMSKTRITVPVLEAVAKRVPDLRQRTITTRRMQLGQGHGQDSHRLNCISTTALLWASIFCRMRGAKQS